MKAPFQGCRYRHSQLGVAPEPILQVLQNLIIESLDVQKHQRGPRRDPNQLIKLDFQGAAVAALRILNEENHKKGNHRGAGVDHQLPGERDYCRRQAKSGRAAARVAASLASDVNTDWLASRMDWPL